MTIFVAMIGQENQTLGTQWAAVGYPPVVNTMPVHGQF